MSDKATTDKLLIYFSDEEHIVRRLGAAVASCWGEFDQTTRDKILARANQVLDEDDVAGVERRLAEFVGMHMQ